jgi:hypothetical protein
MQATTLTYLPTNIGYELVNLRKIWIHMNKLWSLPASVCKMASLSLLDAHFNELCGLPSAFRKLSSLEILNLRSNFSDLKELPASFGDLLNLHELDLSNNQIHALPDSFGLLDKLEKLNLEQNPLGMPPSDVVGKGADAVKEYMSKRWLDILLEEEQKRIAAETPQASSTPKAWLDRSVSWVSGVSGSLVGCVSEPAILIFEASLAWCVHMCASCIRTPNLCDSEIATSRLAPNLDWEINLCS